MFKKLLDRIKGSPTPQMAIPANEEQTALMVAVGNRERRKAYLLKKKSRHDGGFVKLVSCQWENLNY